MSILADKVIDKMSVLASPTNTKIMGMAVAAGRVLRPTPPAEAPTKADPVKHPPLARYPEMDNDPFKVTNFIQSLNKIDGLAKNFQFLVTFDLSRFNLNRPALSNTLTLMTDKIVLPGWRTKTQVGRIYGLYYEIVTGLEQDPVWLSFKIDSGHDIEKFIMSNVKDLELASNSSSQSSFSPRYKNNGYGFSMDISVLDGRGNIRHAYKLEDCFFKTVQNVPYNQGDKGFVEVTCEIIYERVFVETHAVAETTLPSGIEPPTKTLEEKNPDAINRNQYNVGPFSTDISLINQVKDVVAKVPDWLKGTSTKL